MRRITGDVTAHRPSSQVSKAFTPAYQSQLLRELEYLNRNLIVFLIDVLAYTNEEDFFKRLSDITGTMNGIFELTIRLLLINSQSYVIYM